MKTNQIIRQAFVAATLASLLLMQNVAVGQSRSSKSSKAALQKSAAGQTASRQRQRSGVRQSRSSSKLAAAQVRHSKNKIAAAKHLRSTAVVLHRTVQRETPSHPRPTAPAPSSNGKHEPVQGETARYHSRQRGTCGHPQRPAPGRPSNQENGLKGQLLPHVAVQRKPVQCTTVQHVIK